MASKRISKSAIDWAKFAKLVPESDKAMFTAFKARSDLYLRRVTNYPENPPQINWNDYRSKIANKAIVEELEKAYRAFNVPVPEDKWSALVDEQEKSNEQSVVEFCEWSQSKVKEAEELLHKFKVMIPFDKMTAEEYALTFPDWVLTRDKDSQFPHHELTPGLSKEERVTHKIVNEYPYSIAKGAPKEKPVHH